MGEITAIKVDEELTAFVRQQVDDGRYPSESAVIEDALRLLKESEEDEKQSIRAAIEEGEASGEPRPFDFDAFIERKRGCAHNDEDARLLAQGRSRYRRNL